jgi:CubicO group peptidase (beta-lactamase class C family)
MIMMKSIWVTRCCLLAMTLVGSTLVSSGQAGSQAAEPLIGLWGGEEILGPQVAGKLTIDGTGAKWSAKISGFYVEVEKHDAELQFALPNGLGHFRGHIIGLGKEICGHWIQPSGTYRDSEYATPIEFSAVVPRVWVGRVEPLPDKLSLNILFQQASDGSLDAIVRNPESSWLSHGTYSAEHAGSKVVLTNGQRKLEGTYDAQTDRLSFVLVDGRNPAIVLGRRTPADAVDFYPRVPMPGGKYAYRAPLPRNDGWTTGSMQEVGIDSSRIYDLVQSILDTNPADPHSVLIHSLLIARHGRLTLEEYFYGYDAERAHNMYSAGKTIAPLLVGVARDHGAKVDPSTQLYSLFGPPDKFANWDERKNRITVGDLMDMTSGLACDDNDASSPGNEDRLESQTKEPDWYKYTLDLPMARDPGSSTAIYCTAGLNLVGGVAERAADQWNADLFHDYVAKPLQFSEYHFNLTPTGEVYTGGGAYLRPRDEIKLGQLYLADGIWNGRRVLDSDWVKRSTASHSTFVKPVVAIDTNHQYGYGWHIHHLVVGGRDYLEYAAEGNGAQLIMVIPDLDMVVAINGGNYGRSVDWYPWSREVLSNYLIPAAVRQSER